MTRQMLFPLFLILLNAISLIAHTPDACAEDFVATELLLVCEFYPDGGAIPPPNSCDEVSIVIKNGENCNSRMLMKIFVANLAGFNGISPTLDTTYFLPTNMPDMYIEYDSNQDGICDATIGPFRDFNFQGQFIAGINGNHYIFEHEVVLTHDFDDYCSLAGGKFISDNVLVRVLQNNNGQFALYDLAPYSNVNDVFSCAVFHETYFCCSSSHPVGCDPLPTEYFPATCMDCDTPCEALPPMNRLSNSTEDKEKILQKVNPNPFEDHVELIYHTDKELPVYIEVIDVKGNVLQSHAVVASSGNQSLHLDLSNLPVGVYYCKLQYESKIETTKLLKLKN